MELLKWVSGAGFYFGSKEKASSYTSESGSTQQKINSGNVFEYDVLLEKPLIIDSSGDNWRFDPVALAFEKLGMDQEKAMDLAERIQEERGYATTQIMSRGRKKGYDGIVQIGRDGNVSEIVAWDRGAITEYIPA